MTGVHAEAFDVPDSWLSGWRLLEPGFFLLFALALHAVVFLHWQSSAPSQGSGPVSETAVLHGMTADTAALIAAWEAASEPSDAAEPVEAPQPDPVSEPPPKQTAPEAAQPDAAQPPPTLGSPAASSAAPEASPANTAERIPTPRIRPKKAKAAPQEKARARTEDAQKPVPEAEGPKRETKQKQTAAASPASSAPASRNTPVEAPVAHISEAERVSLLRAYGAAVLAAIAQKRRYPHHARQRRQEGTVLMAVTVSREGQLIDARINSSSGYSRLDNASLAAARAVGRFPPAPSKLSGAEFSFTIPIRFEIQSR